MARPATGQVVKPTPSHPCFALRFRAYGKRPFLTLGRPEDGCTLAMAQRELAVVLRDVDLGIWRPPEPDPAPAPTVDPTSHEFASYWFASQELEVEPNTANHYRNDLTNHLLPFFKDHHLSRITVAEVDRYRQSKVRETAEITAAESGTPLTVSYVDRIGRRYGRRAQPLSARSINMHLDLLAQDPRVAVDHGHIPSNPAIGKRRQRQSVQTNGLRAYDAPQRAGARAAQGARPGPRLGSEWAARARCGPPGQPRAQLLSAEAPP